MKVIFLDIDGVLNSHISFKLGRTTPASGLTPGRDQFDPRPCGYLAAVQRITKCEIVMSTTWRHIAYLEQFQQWLGAHGMTVLDCCPSEPTPKPAAIYRWLGEHPGVTKYAVIDDEPRNVEPFKDRGLRTNPEWGLTKGDARKIREMLK
jgi:hypothetical protein